MEAVGEHVARHTAQLLEGLEGLRHADGSPMTPLYGPAGTEGRGGCVAFNLLDPAGRLVDFREVERRANDAGVVRGQPRGRRGRNRLRARRDDPPLDARAEARERDTETAAELAVALLDARDKECAALAAQLRLVPKGQTIQSLIEARDEAALADPDLYTKNPARFAALTSSLEKARAEKDAAEERWLELADMVVG
jgi:hypothetical protein